MKTLDRAILTDKMKNCPNKGVSDFIQMNWRGRQRLPMEERRLFFGTKQEEKGPAGGGPKEDRVEEGDLRLD